MAGAGASRLRELRERPREWLAAVRGRARLARESVAEATPSELVTGATGTVTFLGAFVGFLLVSEWTALFFVGFLVSVGYGWVRHQGATAKAVTFAMTVSTVLVLGLITVFVFVGAKPVVDWATVELFRVGLPVSGAVSVGGYRLALPESVGVGIPGAKLFTNANWSPVAEPIGYSLVPMIHGTLMTTAVATLVAGPLGVAAALFISEIAPGPVRETVKPGVEILAGIPSVVYGFLGFTLVSPWVSDQFSLVGQGTYLFVGMVVGLMALPTVVSVAEDALNSVPESMKDGALALGTTDWQTMTSITLPAAFSGVSAAVLLGVGRAIGETIAATVMLRNSPRLPEPLYNVFYGYESLTSLIAANYGEATGLQFDALFAAGVVLFLSVLAISVGSQLIEWRMQRKLGGRR